MANIVITGVSGGIGLALCRYFLSGGDHHITGISRMPEMPGFTKNTGRTKAGTYTHIRMDIGNDKDIGQLFSFLTKENIHPDILVNNAGVMLNKPFREITEEEFDTVMRINIRAPFMLIRTLLPVMANPSHIVNITSMGGFQGTVKFPGLSVYSAAKGALTILTECLAEELKESGISVNALAPGSVQTYMLAQAFPGYRAPVTADEMARFIGDFALTGNRFFNGKVLPVAVTTP